MDFKFYFPNAVGFSEQHFIACGLDSISREGGFQFEEVRKGGPDREDGTGTGIVATWLHNSKALQAPPGIPKEYRWEAAPPTKRIVNGEPVDVPKGAYYLGWNPAFPPGPNHLARRDQLRGSDVLLADGRPWRIPSAVAIPRTFGIDMETGEQLAIIDTKYQTYCATAYQHAQTFYDREEQIRLLAKVYSGVRLTESELGVLKPLLPNSDSTSVDIRSIDPEKLTMSIEVPDAISHCMCGLELNYRINPLIITVLKLLTEHSVVQCCLAAFDAQAIAAALKKNEQDRVITLPDMLSI